jgi:ABC-type nitrate/sulfonate/bicarbonate transport system permease component
VARARSNAVRARPAAPQRPAAERRAGRRAADRRAAQAPAAPRARRTSGRGPRAAAAAYLPALGLLSLAAAIWQAVVAARGVPPWLLPSPARIAATLVSDRALFLANAGTTAAESVAGLTAAVVVAAGLALGIRFSRTLDRALWPLLVASQTVPVPALAPLLVLWMGYGMAPKIVVVALVCFFPLVVNAVDGLRAADPQTLDALRTLGADRRRLFLLVELPGALPAAFTGFKTAAAYAVIGAVLGEWLGGDRGLGVVMIQAKAQLLTARVFAALVWLSAIGVAMFALAALAERLALPWYHTAERERNWQ